MKQLHLLVYNKIIKNKYSNKYMCTHVHSSMTHSRQRCKQPNFLLMNELINKLWEIHKMKYYLLTKFQKKYN